MKRPAPSRTHGVEHERPVAHELQDDRGLERLDLGQLLGEGDRVEREAEQEQEDDVLDRPKPLVQAPGHAELRHAAALWRRCSSVPEARRRGKASRRTAPRPQNSSATATDDQRMKISGAVRKYSQLKPVISELVKVSTLTTESCALAYQPSQTSVNSRKPRRTQRVEPRAPNELVLEKEDSA